MAARSAINVVPFTLPGFSSAVPVVVTIVDGGGSPVTTYTTLTGSTEHDASARVEATTTFWSNDPIGTVYTVTCVTDAGQTLFAKAIPTGPDFNPGVALCTEPAMPDTAGIADDPDLTSQFRPSFDPRAYGATTSAADNRTAFLAAAAAAEAVGGELFIPPGRWNVPGGLDLTGIACGVVGQGTYGYGTGALLGSVLVDTAQTGAVLTIGGNGQDTTGGLRFQGFGLEGDGTAGSAKKGLKCGAKVVGVTISDIFVQKTGGAPFDFGDIQLSTIRDTIAIQPVSANANAVPYYMATGACRGNTFSGCAMRSFTDDPDALHLVKIIDDGSFAPASNLFSGWRSQYVSVPNSGSVFYIKGFANKFGDCSLHDTRWGTDSSVYTLAAPAVNDFGANEITGTIFGVDGASNPTRGVNLLQSGNVVIGTKGYNGANVTIASGVTKSTVILTGAMAGTTAAGITDNSGTTGNFKLDTTRVAALETRWLPAVELAVSFGSPSFGSTGYSSYSNGPGWMFDAGAAAEAVAGSVVLPADWETFTLDLYWLNNASSAGDVRWNVVGKFATATESPDGTMSAVDHVRILAAPTTAGLIRVDSFSATVGDPTRAAIPNTANTPLFFAIYRTGAEAADTLANDCGLVGVRLTRVK